MDIREGGASGSRMGRRLNLSHLTEEECERILQVIQRDFDLRQKEKDRLGKIEEEIKDEETKTEILAKQPKFNENCCMRCFSRFMFIFNQKVECKWCSYFICKDCSEYVKEEKQYVCNVCLKQRELGNQSFEWFYSNVKKRFKRFGSAKVVRSLYKRKTDSDSENDSGYDPSLYSNSLPVGKRSRQSLQGLFANLNSEAAQKARLGCPLGKQDEDEEEGSDGSDTVLGNETDSVPYQTAYTCTVPTSREKLDPATQDVEVQVFKERLNDIVDDMHQTLENQSPHGSLREDTKTEYERILDNHRLNISSALTKLTQRLHIAIDNQTANSDDLPSPTTKHHMVKQIVMKEVEEYVGRPVDVGEDVTSEYASEDGSSSDIQNQKPYEDILADSIVKMILDDHYRQDTEHHLVEEVNVRNDLTRLSNECTLEQLNEMMSESETDDILSSTRTSLHLETDGESPASEADPETEITLCAPMHEYPELEASLLAAPSNSSIPANANYSDDDLDDLLLSNASDKDWEKLGMKKPPGGKIYFPPSNKSDRTVSGQSASLGDVTKSRKDDVAIDGIIEPKGFEASSNVVESSHDIDTNKNVVDEMITQTSIKERTPEEEIIELRQIAQEVAISKPVAIPRLFVEKVAVSPPSDSDDTLEARSYSDSPVEETPILRKQIMRDTAMPEVEDEEVAFEFARKHKVPLPSFEDDGSENGRDEVDLDDISRKGDEEDLAENVNVETEISFGSNWSLGGPLFKDRSFISAYDNFGERKVGKDVEGPVMMLIPSDGDVPPSPKIGDREVDELSDLSENNNSNSEDLLSSASESDEYDLEYAEEEADEAARVLRRADSSVQTDEAELSGLRQPNSEANVQYEYITSKPFTMTKASDVVTVTPPSEEDLKRRREEKLRAGLSEEEDEENDSTGDGDPQFVERPQSVTVSAGELARFECQVTGSEPIDVFWYRDTTDIHQLDSDEHYEVYSKNGRHYLDIFNTSSEDVGQYLCIAINDVGRCSRRFRVRLSDGGSDQKASPEFLKNISDIEVVEGEQARFRCKLKGYPQPRVLWYKDGKWISESNLVHIEKIGNRDYMLTLDSVSIDDDAEYTVVARNIIGEAKSSAQLIVETRQEAALPREKSVSNVQVADTSSLPRKKKIYPDTQELLKIAERVSAANTHVTDTAEHVLQSADQLSSIHRQLDEMDKKLNHMEDEVHDSMSPQADSVISEDGTNVYDHDTILKEHQEMQSAARSVRQITSTALEVLSSAGDVILAEQDSMTSVQAVEPKTVSAGVWEENKYDGEPNLTYSEFEKLYEMGKVTREQIRTGKFSQSEVKRLRAILHEAWMQNDVNSSLLDLPDDSGLINCGPKRVNSKRYKRDYVVNRSPQAPRKTEVRHWDVNLPTAEGTEIVNASSERDPENLDDTEEEKYTLQSDVIMEEDEAEQQTDQQKDTDSTEDEIYLTAGRVFSLEERIRQLEGQVQNADEDSETLSDLEDEVARAAAMVTQTDQKVTKIEERVSDLEHDVPGADSLLLENQLSNQSGLRTDDQNNQSQQYDTFSESLSLNLDTSEFELDFSTEVQDSANWNSTLKSMRGSTSREELPESRSEFDENLEMPSVKRLRSKFKDTEETSSVKRVSSLTGRDLPKTVREKLRNQSPNVASNSNIRVASAEVSRSGVMSLLDDSELRVVEDPDPSESCVKPSTLRQRTSTPVWEMSGSAGGPNPGRVVDKKSWSPISANTSSGTSKKGVSSGKHISATNAPQTLPEQKVATYRLQLQSAKNPTSEKQTVRATVSSNTDKQPVRQNVTLQAKQQLVKTGNPSLPRPQKSSQDQGAASAVVTKSPEVTSSNYGKKVKSSGIMARAAFWDSRINQGQVSDVQLNEDFPQLSEGSFKSSSEA